MRLSLRAFACLTAIVALSALPGPRSADAARRHAPACEGSSTSVRCGALVVENAATAQPLSSGGPQGLGPGTIKAAYDFPTSASAGAGKTIAIVTAFDAPTIGRDLNVFSRQFGLSPCNRDNGCFNKVNQKGGHRYPRTSPAWALEASLDVEWAHAIAPGAKILLVEATTNSWKNLLAAVDYAKAHAQYVSMSWGSGEFSGERSFDGHFVKSGVSFFAASGDDGLPPSYPSASPNVISVGGTTLNRPVDPVSESAWSGGGGGCSAFEPANPAQAAFSGYAKTGCSGKRATPDVSLDANPASGVAVYDSTSYRRHKGWFVVGGTSASSPMWAARSAVAGAVVGAAYVYGNSISFRDITEGSNGVPCANGYELCTGRGSWVGQTP